MKTAAEWLKQWELVTDEQEATAMLAAIQRDAIEAAAKVIADERRFRPVAWGGEGGPLSRLEREIRALAPAGGERA